MEEKKKIQGKLSQLEETYRYNQRHIEDGLDEVADEHRKFLIYLEQTAEKIRYTAHKYEKEEFQAPSMAYQMLEQTQEEGQIITKKARESLEEQLEANHEKYKKQQAAYEEELYLLKKEEEK